MITFGGFVGGIALVVVGVSMIAKTHVYRNIFGDIDVLLGLYGRSWLSWKLVGMAFIVFGALFAFGFMQSLAVSIFSIFGTPNT